MRSSHLMLLLGLTACLCAAGQARGAVIEELSIEPGGTLDIQPYEILTCTPAETIRQYIQSGSLYSSTHGDVTDPLYTVGFQQVVVDQQEALRVVEALAGDANLDGAVDVSDLGILAGNWGQPGLWPQADFNHDGFIDVSDLGILAGNWEAGVELAPRMSAVPEPTGVGLLCGGTVLWLGRRRRGLRKKL